VQEKTDKKNNRAAHHEGDKRIDVGHGEQHPGGKGPEHDEFAMGDVKHPGNPVLKAQPHGDQGVDAAHEQTGDHDVQNFYDHGESFPALAFTVAGCPKGESIKVAVSTPFETACLLIPIMKYETQVDYFFGFGAGQGGLG
jgi:hypothetical protein